MFTPDCRFHLGHSNSCSRTLGWPALNNCDFSKHGPHAAWSSSFGFCQWQPHLPTTSHPLSSFSPVLDHLSSHENKVNLCSVSYLQSFTIRAISWLSSLSLSLNSTVCYVMSLHFPPLHSRLINPRTPFCSHLFNNRNSGSETGYMYFAPDGKSAQCRHDYSEHFSLLAASCPFLLWEVINYHHLPSNTQATAQTGTPGPPLELWATYSPAGITQTAA